MRGDAGRCWVVVSLNDLKGMIKRTTIINVSQILEQPHLHLVSHNSSGFLYFFKMVDGYLLKYFALRSSRRR